MKATRSTRTVRKTKKSAGKTTARKKPLVKSTRPKGSIHSTRLARVARPVPGRKDISLDLDFLAPLPRIPREWTLGGLGALAIFCLVVSFSMLRGQRTTQPTTTVQPTQNQIQTETQPSAAQINTTQKVSVQTSSQSQPIERTQSHQVETASKAFDPLASEFKEAQRLNLGEKIQYWSYYLETNLAGRGKIASLAAGQEWNDIAPIIPQKYDCTTFVETVVSLVKSDSSEKVLPQLMSVRYKNGQPSFFNRNHFPEADWIPNNIKTHLLSDVTQEVATQSQLVAHVEEKKIDRVKWLAHQTDRSEGRQLASLATVAHKEWPKPIHASIPYIALTDVKQALPYLPNGAILNLVHKNDEKHPVLITHQGFVIREGNQVLLRHASIGGRIRTNELFSYLENLRKQQRPNSSWPLVGINLNQIK